jgi:hypothetical protein
MDSLNAWLVCIAITLVAGCGTTGGTRSERRARPIDVASADVAAEVGDASAAATATSDAPASTETPDTEPPASPPAPVADAAPAVCSDETRASGAVQVALEHAERAARIARAHLADCRFEAARCGAESADQPDGARCVVDVASRYDAWQVKVHPRALDGAPRWFEANLDRSASAPPLRFWASASTWAVGRRQAVVVGGVDGHISHTHGGEPAQISNAEFLFRSTANGPLRIEARRVEWLTGGGCEVPSDVQSTPIVAGLTIGDGAARSPQVTIGPGDVTVLVWFDRQPGYYAYCDRFVARVTFDVGGETIVAAAEWIVTSRQPLRNR